MKKRVAIIGGGMTGLSAAYYLSKKDEVEVYVFERNSNFGGLLGILQIDGVGLEGFYHHLFKRDLDIISLAEELGLKSKLLYLPSKIGIFYEGKIYPFSTPIDLLRFSPISFFERIRLGTVALYLQNFINERNWEKLRTIPAGKWMNKYAGEKAYNVIWKPLLRGKFGPDADNISMAWLWSRLYLRSQSRGKLGSEETLVYLEGGFKILVDRLVAEIEKNGSKLYTDTIIKEIAPHRGKIRLSLKAIKGSAFNKTLVCDACIATIPNPTFVQLTPALPHKIKKRLLKVKYRGAMSVVLQLRRQFMKHIYWLNINDESMNLLAVVEHTNFVNPKSYDNKHILYAGSYPAQEDPVMTMREDRLIDLITEELKIINPLFKQGWIEKYWIFRDCFAQPIVTTDYHTYIPPVETGIPNLYLVNMAQVYPEDRGTNQAARDGKLIAQRLPSPTSR